MENFGQNVLASSVALLLIMAVMGVVYFIWSKANMKKKVKYFEHIHTDLAPGQRVMFGGGIFGDVKSVNGDVVEVKVRSGATRSKRSSSSLKRSSLASKRLNPLGSKGQYANTKGRIAMAEPNILLTRIDNRLIHGQVATQWNSTLGSNLILVANDEVSTNTMRQNLMKMAAPTGVQTRFFSIQKTIDVIHKASPAQKIFIVLDSPQDALKLVEGGVPIKKLNIGNMHMAEGKRQVATTVAVNDDDVECFRKLQEHGVELSIQRVPSTPVEDTNKLFA